MPSLQALRRKIGSVKNTQKITKAMKMVAAAKLRRAQEKVLAARPYAGQLAEMLGRLAASDTPIDHPLLQQREVNRVALVVFSGDRGLCGSYNVNVLRRATAELARLGRSTELIAIGRKGRDFFRRRGRTFAAEFLAIGEEPTFAQAREIAAKLMAMYSSGEVDEVRLVYTEFRSALSQRPVEVKLLPLDRPAREQGPAADATGKPEGAAGPQGLETPVEYIYEPSPNTILGALVPKAVETQVYRALLESKASEHGARMTAMGNATQNAGELIGKLTLAYNRARQAAITREVSEIVSGAEALK